MPKSRRNYKSDDLSSIQFTKSGKKLFTPFKREDESWEQMFRRLLHL